MKILFTCKDTNLFRKQREYQTLGVLDFVTSVTASITLLNISLLAAITPLESNVLPFPKFNGAPVTSPT